MIIVAQHDLAWYVNPIINWSKVRSCIKVDTETMMGILETFNAGGDNHYKEVKIDRLVAADDIPDYDKKALEEMGVEIISARVLEELPNYDE